MTRAGSTTPISPLASIAKAQAHQAATSQRNDTAGGSSTARAKASTATVISPPTSMSWLAYWPPTKKNGQVASTPRPMVAARAPCQRRSAKNKAAPIIQAPSIGAKRAANAFTPTSDIAAMSSQYISGGLWKNGRPFSVGTQASPSSISRATLA